MKTVLKSNCCHADTMIDWINTDDYSAKYYYCRKCNLACKRIEVPDIEDINTRLESLEKAINELKK